MRKKEKGNSGVFSLGKNDHLFYVICGQLLLQPSMGEILVAQGK